MGADERRNHGAAPEIKPSRPTEVTPGTIHRLGLPSMLQNQSRFNFWDVKTEDYFVELDDEDGKLSRKETPLMLQDSFERYDTDGDGDIILENANGWE